MKKVRKHLTSPIESSTRIKRILEIEPDERYFRDCQDEFEELKESLEEDY